LKLPRDLSAADLEKALGRAHGYRFDRQLGSHRRVTTQTHGEPINRTGWPQSWLKGYFALDTFFPKWEHLACARTVSVQMYMRVISRRPLNELAKRYPDAKVELDA